MRRINVWMINHYAVPLKYWPGNRTPQFAKYLLRAGYNVRVIAASTVHNSDINLIEDGRLFREEVVDGVPYTYIKCHQYEGNGIKRIYNMFEFPVNLNRVYKQFGDKPDVVLGSSLTPFACVEAICIAKHYKVKSIVEIRDLWPESAIAYGWIRRSNPILIPMFFFEKKLYEHADELVFTMEGAYDYIKERGWDKDIPKSKVHYINNGVDLEEFDANKVSFKISDNDLKDDKHIKAVYVGSIRHANNIGALLDIAKQVNSSVKFLIWGTGDKVQYLNERIQNEKLDNVIYKGVVEKKYIPYIVSMADVNLMDMTESTDIFKYGISPNKLFDYFAAKKPIIMYRLNHYNPAIECGVGFVANDFSEIVSYLNNGGYKKNNVDNFEVAREKYSYENLTKKLIKIIKG